MLHRLLLAPESKEQDPVSVRSMHYQRQSIKDSKLFKVTSRHIHSHAHQLPVENIIIWPSNAHKRSAVDSYFILIHFSLVNRLQEPVSLTLIAKTWKT